MARFRKLQLTVAATAMAAASVLGTGVAGAQTTDDVGPRVERACRRVPNMLLRTDALIERLQGDATVRGSLAWLQVQIDEAAAAGRTQLVTVLENRLAVRTATIDVLVLRQAGLVELQQTCDELLGQG